MQIYIDAATETGAGGRIAGGTAPERTPLPARDAHAMHPAVKAVLFNRALLTRALAAGPLNEAADLARVAGACRFFASVMCGATADAELWRPVWQRECASMRDCADAVALPKGKGFCAALRQRAHSRMPPPPPQVFTVSDFILTVDCTWRGEPLYSARFPLSSFEEDLFNHYQVYDRIASQKASNLASSSCADAFARKLLPDGATFSDLNTADKSCFAELSASVYVVRSDGAVACIAAGGKTTGEIVSVEIAAGGVQAASCLYLGCRANAKDCIGPFVDFDFKGGRLLKYSTYHADVCCLETKLYARFLLLFAPRVLNTTDVLSNKEPFSVPTFSRGELQLVACDPEDVLVYSDDDLDGPGTVSKAMTQLHFVPA